MAADAHFGGPVRIPVRNGERLLAQAAGPPPVLAAGTSEGPPHHVVGGKFSKRAAATRIEAAIGLGSPPHMREKTPPSRPQVRSIDSATKHFGASISATSPSASQPPTAASTPDAVPRSLTPSSLASTLGDIREKLARWASALPTGSEHHGLLPDVARRRRKADIAEAMRAAKKLLRRGRRAVEVLEEIGSTAPSVLSEAVQELSTQFGGVMVQELIHTGRIELASQWSTAFSGWLGSVAALVPPLAAICVDGANTIACVCLSRSNLPDDANSSTIRALATSASQAVRHALKALKTLRAQDKVAPGVHPTSALAARCHLNGCAADGRIGRHRPALEHATRARKAALFALADMDKKHIPATVSTAVSETSKSEKQSADAAELLVLAWHAAGAQHECLDEPAFCLAAYEKAHAACEKHSIVDSALRVSVRRDLESAQRRFAKNRALTTLEIQRGIDAELGGGGPPPKRKQTRSRRRRGVNPAANTDGDVATGAAREEMNSSMFTGIHKPKKAKKKQQERPVWDARPASLASVSNGRGGRAAEDTSAKLRLPTAMPTSDQGARKRKGRRGRAEEVPIAGERKTKAEGRAAVRQVNGHRGEKAVVIRATTGSLSLPPIRVC